MKPPKNSDLLNRYQKVLITGGSSGLGAAFVELFLTEGLKVFATSRHPETQQNKNVHWLKLDASSREGLDQFLEDHSAILAEVDLIVLNAGAATFADWADFHPAPMRQQLDLLVSGTLELSQAHLKLRQSQACTQVWISSLASEFPLPYLPLYSGAKAALASIAQNLRLTSARTDWTLIDFQPGDYQTAFNANLKRPDGSMNSQQQAVWQQLEQNLANGPKPEQAAQDLKRALLRGKSACIRSGTFFQTTLAPLAKRLLPQSAFQVILRAYFHLRS